VHASPVVNNARKLEPLSPVDATSIDDSTSSTLGSFSLNSPLPVRKLRTPLYATHRESEGGRRRAVVPGKENTPSAHEKLPTTPRKEDTPSTKENGMAKMSGRKPRSRSRAGVLADLTGFAKNVDLSAHGMPKSRGKGTLRSALDLRNVSRTDVRSASRVDLRSASRTDLRNRSRTDLNARQNASKASLNDHYGTPNVSSPDLVNASTDVNVSGAANTTSSSMGKDSTRENASTTDLLNASTDVNVSGAANTTSSTIGKGSVRDRMREWERERERLREMERLTEMQREAESILTSVEDGSDDETELSDAEVECTIERDEALEAHGLPVVSCQASPVEMCVKDEPKVEEEVGSIADADIDPNVLSYRADLSEEHIEIARIGVRATARLLSTDNGSTSVLGMVRSNSASTAPGKCFLGGSICGMLMMGMCV
jgi:hypothetical protein